MMMMMNVTAATTSEESAVKKTTAAAAATVKRLALPAHRTFSADIRLYVDEEALARVLSPSLSATAAAANIATSSTTTTDNNNNHSNTGFDFPAATSLPSPAIADDSSLGCEWMNRSFQPDEFERVLRNPDVTLTGYSFDPAADLESEEEGDDGDDSVILLQQPIAATQIPFESILELDDFSAPSSPVPAPSAAVVADAAAPSRKRGRPTKDETGEPAPKKARAAKSAKVPSTPAAPKIHPLARPTTDDPVLMERYLKYRQTNNEAACKSRLRRKEREQQSAGRVVELEAQNQTLKRELSTIQAEVLKLKALLEAHLRKQK